MNVALETFESWKKVPARERAEYLFKAAALMRDRKHEFSALMILESGKNYVEADVDTAEAIDFIEFYAREMIRLSEINETQPLAKIPGENNQISYIPLRRRRYYSALEFPASDLCRYDDCGGCFW